MGKNKNKLPDMLKKKELTKLFENMFIPKLAIACFVALMCGLRVREVCQLQVSDINLENRYIKIRDSKNPNRSKQGNYGKDRIQYFPECAVSPISKWLEVIQGSKWFLPSENKVDTHLRVKTLHNWFREARERAGLNEIDYVVTYKKPTKYRKSSPVYRLRFHHLRHFYATYTYEKSRDIYAVSGLLGHNQVSTTQIYAKISDKIKKETVDFVFNNPIRTKIFEKNPMKAENYTIPTIAKEEKVRTPIEIIEERFAKGEISDIEYQNKIRLLKLRKDNLPDKNQKESKEPSQPEFITEK